MGEGYGHVEEPAKFWTYPSRDHVEEIRKRTKELGIVEDIMLKGEHLYFWYDSDDDVWKQNPEQKADDWEPLSGPGELVNALDKYEACIKALEEEGFDKALAKDACAIAQNDIEGAKQVV